MKIQALLLIGPTGSGKTPLGEALERCGLRGRRCVHLDFGALLRSAAQDPQDYQLDDEEHAFINKVLNEGLLLEDDRYPLAEKMFKIFFSLRSIGPEALLILNGFPRHLGQARSLESIVAVRELVVLECSPEAVLRRIDSNVARDRSGRSDDRREMIEKKLDLYRQRTEPLIEHYSQQHAEITRVQVTEEDTGESLYRALAAILQES